MFDSTGPSRSARSSSAPALRFVLAASALLSMVACKPQAVPNVPIGPKATPKAAEVNPHRCDLRAVVLGDSRVTEQGTVLPRTSDAVVARVLGIRGALRSGGGRDHVEIYAAPGTVHRQHADELRAFTATCSAKERPLVIDVLGTNYLYEWAARPTDPAAWTDIAAEVDAFYAANAPRALVALQELHLDTTQVTGVDRTTVETYVAGYNTQVLRALATANPGRYLVVRAPVALTDGSIVFRDALHPTSASLMAFYAGGLTVADLVGAAAFDAAATTAIARANSACAVLDLPGFDPAVNSQTRMLIAQLAATSPSQNPKVAAWLKRAATSPYRLRITRTTETCRPQLATRPPAGPADRIVRAG